MGKSEILMLLAGVALSIMLAMVAIPIFKSSEDMVTKYKIEKDFLAVVNVFKTNPTILNTLPYVTSSSPNYSNPINFNDPNFKSEIKDFFSNYDIVTAPGYMQIYSKNVTLDNTYFYISASFGRLSIRFDVGYYQRDKIDLVKLFKDKTSTLSKICKVPISVQAGYVSCNNVKI
ncbi:hypothetical protein NG751_04075 [Aliarcobacter cryaerophilus]|uniref:hypothetical protein n=1 Tax=Aliarcobacter cryaerophilus TaxID=28198 RepID=UPI003DA1D36A